MRSRLASTCLSFRLAWRHGLSACLILAIGIAPAPFTLARPCESEGRETAPEKDDVKDSVSPLVSPIRAGTHLIQRTGKRRLPNSQPSRRALGRPWARRTRWHDRGLSLGVGRQLRLWIQSFLC
jgi:hypothetical protein